MTAAKAPTPYDEFRSSIAYDSARTRLERAFHLLPPEKQEDYIHEWIGFNASPALTDALTQVDDAKLEEIKQIVYSTVEQDYESSVSDIESDPLEDRAIHFRD